MAKEKSESVKGIEIPIYFHNYKLLKDKSFVLKGSHIYFVQGPNGVGKTTFLKALTSLQIASDDTTDKVSRGESEGVYEAKIPASDGSFITIRHEFTDNNKGKFIAIREDGTKISQVTEIRKLFNYTPIDVNQFFAMSNSSEGRRKQRDIILKLLPDKSQHNFNEADLREEHYYNQRTEVGRNLENAKSALKESDISEEDNALLNRKEEALALIKKYEDAKLKKTEDGALQAIYDQLQERKESLLEQLKSIDKQIEEIKVKMDTKNKTSELSLDEINERIEKGKTIINRIVVIETRKENKDKYELKTNDLQVEYDKLSKAIENCREEKHRIVSESDLPVENISFDQEGYLTINGFKFKENQICESDAVLILANILAKINPGPIQVIGDASILDNEKLEKLNKIAESNNKIMFVDEVIRSGDDIVVVGYEELNNNSLKDNLDKVAKPKKSVKQVEENPEILEKLEHPLTEDDSFIKEDDETLF